MDNRAATLLQKYAMAGGPKYGPSETDMSNGPGGAAATNKKYSRQSADGRKIGTFIQQDRSIGQMRQVMDIYNQATKKLKKTPSPHGNFNPEDQGI